MRAALPQTHTAAADESEQELPLSSRAFASSSMQTLPEVSETDPLTKEKEELEALAKVYEPTLTENAALIQEGRISEATLKLLKVVPEAKRTAAHNLFLGNALYSIDRKQSYKLHLEALRQSPQSAAANLEAAFELQRAGNSRNACPLYERYLKSEPAHQAINALLAHCLLDTGNLQAAVDAWKHANQPDNHTDIEEAISEVFGLESPWSVRAGLISQMGEKDAGDVLGALIRHDLAWPINWWNDDPSYELARKDLATFGPRTGPEIRKALALLIETAQNAESPSDDLKKQVRAELHTRASDLPTPVLRGLVDYGLRGKIVTAEDAFKWLRPTMENRAFSNAGTAEDVELLAGLAQGHDETLLNRADSDGWEKLKVRVCAESLFVRKARTGKLSANEPTFKAALAAFPDSLLLHAIALELASQDNTTRLEALRRVILAEFHNLSTSPEMGTHSSYGLTALFHELAQSLKAK